MSIGWDSRHLEFQSVLWILAVRIVTSALAFLGLSYIHEIGDFSVQHSSDYF